MEGIYLDYAATTPVHPEVLEAMLPYWTKHFGNASSLHAYGRTARNAVNESRDLLADLLRCKPNELVFTGSGTESDNLAILGTVRASERGKHVITTQIEHSAVLQAFAQLEREGFEVTYVPVRADGRIDAEDVIRAVRADTALVSVMLGNNETGMLQPVEAIGQNLRARGVPFHVDAVQALGKVRLNLSEFPADLVTLSAHKINGPKGIGALVAKRSARIEPLVFGGSQERKLRPGTESVAAIVGFAKAAELALRRLEENITHLRDLKMTFWTSLQAALAGGDCYVNGTLANSLPHILNVSFPGAKTESLLMNLDLAGVAASGGSACTAGAIRPSHVLQAMNVSEERLVSAVRFSFGYSQRSQDVHNAAEIVATCVNRLRM
ncbi:cysteine desulfurase [Xylanibacillus composti]|uniref:Cysteine desulfurase n=1 Tax=Xylanibacillus composti TaxID=1572762 RepID=A0A8J4M3H5_9BACL|nr:cysteine desulfurase family protein [Xylanibacillus composti]GIQ70115.1 cysteine desulfurase [Xylanibacillus composti]